MKHFLLASLISFGALASPVLTPPAIAQTQLESIQDMASWMQEITTIQTDLANIFSAGAMETMYSVINEDDDDEIRRFGQQFEAERQAVLARARNQIEAISPPDKWNIDRSGYSKQEKQIYQAAKKHYASLNETYSLFNTLTETLSDILNNPEDLDDDGLIELLKVQHKAGVRLIELENEQVDGYLTAIPIGNPNHQFQKIVKQFNLASIQELEIAMFENDLDSRRALAEDMKAELKQIRPLIKIGQRNLQTQLKEFRGFQNNSNLSQADKNMIPIVIKVFETFDETFEVETKLLDTMESSYKLYISDRSDEDIEPSIDENGLTFLSLIDTRIELQQYRLSLMQ